jgi:hypothetical protein
MMAANVVTSMYHAGTIALPVRSISHATTNCVVPPKIVVPSA